MYDTSVRADRELLRVSFWLRGFIELASPVAHRLGVLLATAAAASTSGLRMESRFPRPPREAWWLAGTLAFLVLVVPLARASQEGPSSSGTSEAPSRAVQETDSNTGM